MNTKKLILFLCMALTGMLLSGCGGGGQAAYRIATDTTFAPFEFQDSTGNFVGIDMDLIKAISEDQGFDYTVDAVGFNGAVQALESGQADAVIAGMSITEERAAKFDFSEPYFDSGVVMAVGQNNQTVKGYEDLRGKRVAVKTGTEGYRFAQSIEGQYGFEMVVFDETANMFEDVKIGSSIACFDDYPVVAYAVSQGVPIRIASEKERGCAYGIAVRKGRNQELLAMLNNGLSNIKANGTYDEIISRYIKQ